MLLLLLLAAAAGVGEAVVYDYERDFGAVPYSAANPATARNATAWANGAAFNVSFNRLQPGDTVSEVTFSFFVQLFEKYGTLIEKVPPCSCSSQTKPFTWSAASSSMACATW
eukprot:SAG31_NODE_8911_length_1364_cov_8.283004_1_plen_112_part_00